jgi:hypothetical protein
MERHPELFPTLADELRLYEARREKFLGLIDSAISSGDRRDVAGYEIAVLEIEAQIEQIKVSEAARKARARPKPPAH